jgi:hypothetical protein
MLSGSFHRFSRMFVLIATVGFGGRSAYADPPPPPPPPLPAPPLAGPQQGAVVYVGGGVLKNQSTDYAKDIRISFEIPGLFENINQTSISIGVGGVVNTVAQFANEGLSHLNHDIIPVNLSLPPKGILEISVIVDSEKKNAIHWLENMKLTDDSGDPVRTQAGLGGFIISKGGSKSADAVSRENISPVTYTFLNDGSDLLHVDQIKLGLSNVFITDNSLETATDISAFTNGGSGWDVLPGMSIPLSVPFDIPSGDYLAAEILGTAAPGTTDAMAVDYFQEHQSVPETSTWLLMLLGFAGLGYAGYSRFGYLPFAQAGGQLAVPPRQPAL